MQNTLLGFRKHVQAFTITKIDEMGRTHLCNDTTFLYFTPMKSRRLTGTLALNKGSVWLIE